MFYKQGFNHLWRKWLSLPLVLLFPVILIGLFTFLGFSIFTPSKEAIIEVGLIDLDQSEETIMVIDMMEDASQLGDYIHMTALSEKEAKEGIRSNTLSAYVVFPDNFTESLYKGKSVALSIVGNPKQPIESMMINELVGSIARHIRTSQANILTIYDYATEMGISAERRHAMLFEQFTKFLMFTIGKDNVITEEKLINQASASPIHYYSVASLFIVITVWFFSIYSLLSRETPIQISRRMTLYGVTLTEQILARILTSLTVVGTLIILTLFLLIYGMKLELEIHNAIHVFFILLIFGAIFLFILAIINTLIHTSKFRILVQAAMMIGIILLSGAIIPTIYFPLSLQKYSSFLFSTEALQAIMDIIMNQGNQFDYNKLVITLIVSFFIFIAISIWKGRVFK